MLKESLKAKKLILERRLSLYAMGVANSTPSPSVSALKPMARERKGLISCGIVAAGGLGMGRTYSLGVVGSIGSEGAIGAAASLEEAADFAKLFGCNPVAEDRSRAEGSLSAG